MAKVIGLPKLSPTMEEGVLVRWARREGDRVEVDDLIAEVETDKATMEFRAFDAGVLLKLLVNEGASLKPDEPVAVLGKEGEVYTDDVITGLAQPAPSKASAPSQETAAPTPSAPAQAVASAPAANGRVLASPLVRRVARERGLDLTRVQGTGPKGRIILRDVEGLSGSSAYEPQEQGSAPVHARHEAPLAPALGGRVEPLSGMRKAIAQRLSQSKREIPHFYLTAEVDTSALEAMRREVNAELPDGEKTSINDWILRASALALRRLPACNASFEENGIRYFDDVHLSVAVSVQDGLVTPVVRNAQQKSLGQIAREVKELAQKARDKKLKPEDMAGGTFSVSNLGMYGIDQFAAVIRPPEAAILAVGAIRDVPVVKDGAVVPGRRMGLTLSCDHRVIDGALGAELLKQIRVLLERPLALLVG